MKLAQYITGFNTCRKSFAFKIFGSLIAVIFIILSLFSLIQIYQEVRSAKENLISTGKIVSGFLAGSSRTSVVAEDKKALERGVKNVMDQKEVLSVFIYSLNWKVIAGAHRKTVAGNRSAPYQEISTELAHSRTFKIIETPESIDVFTPISIDTFSKPLESLYFEKEDMHPKEKIIGYVRIGLDKTILTDRIKAVFLRILALALILALSSTVIIYVAAKRVSLPIIQLTERVRTLGREGNTEKITLEANDEIGKLADAFNQMAEDLRKREDEKKALENALTQSKRMEALGTLARGIAHDFNNILSTVQGASFIMRKKLDERSPLQEYIKKIHTSLARAEDLIQGLLAFSRGQELDPQPVNINTLIKKMAPFCIDCSDVSIQSVFSLPDEDLTVICDRPQIEQVLLNLVSNAHQAMSGGGTLSISTKRIIIDSRDNRSSLPLIQGAYALIIVSDTGTGMQEGIKERIFEPFFTTKETGKGTGLGLAIAYSIIKQYRGHIDVSTQTGKGTAFYVYLPMVDKEKENTVS